MNIRPAREEEFIPVHEFVLACPPLEAYARHFYKIILRYFGRTCFVAEQDGALKGFLLGFLSQSQADTFFLWQIGSHPDARGQGLGRKLLKAAEKEAAARGAKRIELTIDPQNDASRLLFSKCGYRNISRDAAESVEVNGHPAVKDHYGPGRHFMLFEKQL